MRPIIALVLLFAVAACTEYRPVHQRTGESWLQAKHLAYRDDIAKHPVGQSQTTGPRPFAIGPGQHLVMQGETLSQLASSYQVSMRELAQLNRISTPFPIYVGQVLVLPEQIGVVAVPDRRNVAEVRVSSIETVELQSLNVGAPRGTSSVLRETGRVQSQRPPLVELEEPIYPSHTVRHGESLAGIGAHHGYKLGEMLSVNRHINPAKLREGQTVYIPDESRAVYPSSRSTPMDAQTVARIKQAAESTPPRLSGDGFLAPVQGQVIGRFGGLSNGMRNDGINIAVPPGTAVKASEAGVVVFRGENVGDFGRLLLIRHEGNFVTAYGHNRELLVKVGDRVERGQMIARSGKSGRTDEPQLHFQIRQGSTPIDPRTELVDAGFLSQG